MWARGGRGGGWCSARAGWWGRWVGGGWAGGVGIFLAATFSGPGRRGSPPGHSGSFPYAVPAPSPPPLKGRPSSRGMRLLMGDPRNLNFCDL